ncbi:anti-sigma factor [Pseudomonas sp. P9_2]|nr:MULTISPECIES: anti-sigma factor [Pseudomonas]WPN54395.1 anti-sigma factor [Pseudomonas sp. P9_2]
MDSRQERAKPREIFINTTSGDGCKSKRWTRYPVGCSRPCPEPNRDNRVHGLTTKFVEKRLMTAIQPQVIEQKPPFWSRPRLFIGACVVVVAGIGGALYTQDSVKSAATLVNTTQQPAAQIMAHKDYLEVQPIASTAPAPDQSLELWAIPKDGTPVSLGLLPEDGEGIIGLNPRQQETISKPVELMVSSETKGGSISKQPTGPTVYQGALATR